MNVVQLMDLSILYHGNGIQKKVQKNITDGSGAKNTR